MYHDDEMRQAYRRQRRGKKIDRCGDKVKQKVIDTERTNVEQSHTDTDASPASDKTLTHSVPHGTHGLPNHIKRQKLMPSVKVIKMMCGGRKIAQLCVM